MTLIVTSISRHGIIHASDSNLTGGDDKSAGTGQKTFPIEYLYAGLTVAGNYSVNGVRMDIWMQDFITIQEGFQNITLEKFSKNLKDELQNRMTKEEKQNGSMIHIAGYAEIDGKHHPEFWFVRNVHEIDNATGGYKSIDQTFEISEDFWSRDCPKHNLMKLFQEESRVARQFYINGLAPGRIGFFMVTSKLDEFFNTIWTNRNWKFRPPKSIEESINLLKIYMNIINELFLQSEYNAQYIGGGIQIHSISQPETIAVSC